ncbi:MAG TPA: PAS domain S-box protein [Thermoplasmata archaeon]|nr:PAS domain S-box protein [Thermoplasmata archaeon]
MSKLPSPTRPSEGRKYPLEPIAEYKGFLENVLEASTEYSIIAADLEGRVILWNEGARRIYGFKAEEIVGKDTRVLHDPSDVESGLVDRLFKTVLQTGKYEGVMRRQRQSGEPFTARVVMTVVHGEDSAPLGFLIVSKDITEDELLHQRLIDSEEYNRGLIESNIDGLMTTDPIGIITDVNRRMEELTGRPREELISTPFKNYFTDPSRAEEGIRRVLAEERVTNSELTLQARDGSKTIVSYNATTFRGRDGKLKGVFAAARDVTEQKKLEADLRESQNYNRGLIEASLDALVTVDREGHITDLNRQMEAVAGFPREDLIGSRFADYFTEPDRALAGIARTLEEGFVTNYELVLRPRTGPEKVVSFNASVFRDVEGEVRGIFASARDITAQQRLQEQLRESQLYNRSLIEASPDALVMVDPEFVITDVNEQMVKVTGYPREELVGSPFKNHFEEPNLAVAGVRQTFERGSITNYELVLRPKNRQSRVVSLNASVFRDPEGHVKGIFASARDITEQRALEEKLQESQNYNRGLIEASVDAMVIVDSNLVITDVNEQMLRLTRRTRKQLIGSSFIQYFTEPDRAASGIRQTLERGFVTNYELVFRSKNDQETPVSLSASVFLDVEGRVKGVFASARDITEQKKLEGQLRDSQNYNRGLIESSIDALFTTDAVGIVTDVNRQMEYLTGLPREQLVGTPLKNYFTRPELAEDGVRRVLEQNRLTNFELVLKSANGSTTPVSFNATTFRGADGALKGIFASSRDVTEQKKLEADLRESENYNRSLIEAAADVLVTVDPTLTITDVNEQMVKVAGYARNELIGSQFPDYFTDPARAGAAIRKTLNEGIVTNYELTLRSRHGRLIHVSINASGFKDTEGHVRGIFASARDITEQKRLQEQLRESQLYNRSLIEASPDALVTVDPDLVVTDVNEQMVKLTGQAREKLIGSPFKEYFTDPERAAAGVRSTLLTGSVTNYELILRSVEGRRTLVSFNAAVFKDAEGKVAGVFASARDITDQKKTEEKLRESQIYNRGLIEASPDALVTIDPDLVITDVNEEMVRLTGYLKKHLIGSRFPELFTDPSRAESGVHKALEERSVSNFELILRKRNGQKIPISLNAGTAFDLAGNIRGVLAAARNITEQKALESQLLESQNYNRGLVESNIDALMTTDVLGTITDVNRQMEVVTGISRDQLIGTPFKKYFTDPAKAEEGIRRVLSEDRVTNFELTIRAPGGRSVDVSYNATTFRDTEGRLKGVFAAARDVTESTRLREQIEQRNRELEIQNRRVQEANRLKSEFLANMSHELRTPLNSIIGFSEHLLAQEPTGFSPEHREYMQDILNSGHHLLQLINDVLDLAKVEAGKMELSLETFSARKIVDEVCSVVKPLVEEKHLHLTADVASGLESVTLDPLRFKQVLYNLVSNAVKFTDSGGHVAVHLAPKRGGKSFTLEVRDTGIGIASEDLPRLFREFEQLDAGPGRRFQGSGLGLSLTKKIVELHGGTIEVTSMLGKGTTFHVTMPVTVNGGPQAPAVGRPKAVA